MPEAQIEQQKPKFSPGTLSIIRNTFALGYYYGKNYALINVAQTMMPYSKENIKKELDELIKLSNEIELMERKIKMAELGMLYLDNSQKRDLLDKIINNKTLIETKREPVINFCINVMEDAGIMMKAYTPYHLSKLPLKLSTEGEDDEYGGEYEP